MFATYVLQMGKDSVNIMNDNMRHMRMADVRSERRIMKNRLRRQREMKKNFLILVMTVCLIVTGSLSLNGFRSNAQDDSAETSYKAYKSVCVANNDTLWSLAKQYMDEEHYDSVEEYIEEVKRMNGMTDDMIRYGEYLIVPYYSSEYSG